MGYGLLIVQKASRNKRGQGEGVLLFDIFAKLTVLILSMCYLPHV